MYIHPKRRNKVPIHPKRRQERRRKEVPIHPKRRQERRSVTGKLHIPAPQPQSFEPTGALVMHSSAQSSACRHRAARWGQRAELQHDSTVKLL